MRLLRRLGWAVGLAIMAVVALRLVFPLPDITARPNDPALPVDPATRLAVQIAPQVAPHPRLSGVIPLTSVMAIFLAAFPSTRGLVVLRADDVTPFETGAPSDTGAP